MPPGPTLTSVFVLYEEKLKLRETSVPPSKSIVEEKLPLLLASPCSTSITPPVVTSVVTLSALLNPALSHV